MPVSPGPPTHSFIHSTILSQHRSHEVCKPQVVHVRRWSIITSGMCRCHYYLTLTSECDEQSEQSEQSEQTGCGSCGVVMYQREQEFILTCRPHRVHQARNAMPWKLNEIKKATLNFPAFLSK